MQDNGEWSNITEAKVISVFCKIQCYRAITLIRESEGRNYTQKVHLKCRLGVTKEYSVPVFSSFETDSKLLPKINSADWEIHFCSQKNDK